MTEAELERVIFGDPVPTTDFRPLATYNPEGDCIEFLVSNESFRAERIDSLVTVYYGRESKEIVGSLIKGVSGFIAETLRRNPGFQIDIEGGRVKLCHLFTAKMWLSPDEIKDRHTIVYKHLRGVAQQANAEVELEAVCV